MTIGPRGMVGRAIDIVRPVLIDKVERDHWQSDVAFLRRRIVAAITLALGATLLGLSFSVRQGNPAFYPLTFGLAAAWTLGGLLSGPLHLGHILLAGRLRRDLGQFFTDQVERTTVETGEKIQDRDVLRTYRRHDETLLELLPKDLKRRVCEPIAVRL